MDTAPFGIPFRQSENVEDRRDLSQPAEWGRALWAAFREEGPSLEDLKAMARNPMTPWRDILAKRPLSPATPLAVEAGANDIHGARDRWLAQRRLDELAGLAKLQADPNVHSFESLMDPSGPPVKLDRRKLPFMDQPAPNPILAGRQPGAAYNTPLDPGMEQFFRMWVDHNKVPFNPDSPVAQDYDMRGFFRGLMQGDPRAQSSVNPNDEKMHFPDFWKTPLHQSFSNESQWAPADAPQWTPQDALAKGGRVLFDERAPAPFGLVVAR